MTKSILQERAEEILSYAKDMVTEAFADRNFISADRANQFFAEV